MEETTGAPSSFAALSPRRLRASSRDGGGVVNRPPSSLTMLLSRHTRRREVVAGVSAAAAWPFAARAQQAPERMRRIGVLQSLAGNDPEGPTRMAGFMQGLEKLGWIEGRNFRIDSRWAAGDADLHRQYAAELVALAPDVILATASPSVSALQAATRTIPI